MGGRPALKCISTLYHRRRGRISKRKKGLSISHHSTITDYTNMADYTTSKTWQKHDDYMTPADAWQQIDRFIPKDKVIWEPFYGDGASKTHLEKLGCKEVIHRNEDFFENDHGEIVVSNPPFSKAKEVLTRLKSLNKPFILIMPTAKMITKYYRQLFENETTQIIIPKKSINFIKMSGGKVVMDLKSSRCSFDCYYYCWKMNLPKDIIYA